MFLMGNQGTRRQLARKSTASQWGASDGTQGCVKAKPVFQEPQWRVGSFLLGHGAGTEGEWRREGNPNKSNNGPID